MRDKFINITLTAILGISAWTLSEVMSLGKGQVNNDSEIKHNAKQIGKNEKNIDDLKENYYSLKNQISENN
ncbi:hypothetical protein [uncultured Winogradskyella sp.]|uniref:hypothetical protein n=1 Tax=uncultured Winogradskyella sp. TaxID=395353 RepID=UPI00260687D3|nr:hypothetical protein [uncultured Winogradskyella sp.]